MLENYVRDLSRINPSTLEGPQDCLASWLNLYNAMVILEVLKHYPVKNMMQIKNFFGVPIIEVGGEKLSLMDIENKIFRDALREPRAVFARANGSTSGGRLGKVPFTALKVEEQLEERTFKFLTDKQNVDYDPRRKLLTLSAAFLWYQEEFVDLNEFLRSYLDLLPKYYQISFRGYDWKLNDEKLH